MGRTFGVLLLVGVVTALLIAGCQSGATGGRSTAEPCRETPAQDRWPTDYGRARGQRDIWLVDNGGAHGVGVKRKVAWRVVGGVEQLSVMGRRTDGGDTFQLTVSGRVSPNGNDYFPQYWDSVSYLTFPSAGCWTLDLRAGEIHEQITLDVRES